MKPIAGFGLMHWPLRVPLDALDGKQLGAVDVMPGLTILVGPNGSGKTRALRDIQLVLTHGERINQYNRKVRFLAAGRSSPFESFRSSNFGPNTIDVSDAAVGHFSYRPSWWAIESITGDLLALDLRSDLKLKVEARLQHLFDRRIELTWSQSGLTPRISSMRGGASYPANREASGILQLVALLAAIHNDEIGALLIDEPEISLHPQHQAFVLEEMERVAGDPSDPAKKLIIFATHAPTLCPLRSERDLPSFSFFNDISNPPSQIAANEPVLQSGKLKALIARLSATHRMAMFAERILLVEGPSDETVVTQLAHRMDWPLLARNAQVLPATGKGEFPEVAKLFRLMNKQIAVLADLDALADDNKLTNFFSCMPGASHAASRMGAKSISALDGDLRSDLERFISENDTAVDHVVAAYPKWFTNAPADIIRKRTTLAQLLTAPERFGANAAAAAIALSQRYRALLQMLAEVGCFFLQAGAIENYYAAGTASSSKPNAAADEAATFEGISLAALERRYADVICAIRYIAPARGVDENLILRPKLGAAIAALFQSITPTTPSSQLNEIARGTIGSSAEIFSFENISTDKRLSVRISIASPLFRNKNFPLDISTDENVNAILPQILATED